LPAALFPVRPLLSQVFYYLDLNGDQKRASFGIRLATLLGSEAGFRNWEPGHISTSGDTVMSIAGILASSLFSSPLSQVAQRSTGANGPGSASQSGNASGAQSFFADLQQKLTPQSTSSAGPTSLSGQMNQLGDDLESGNIGSAQTDFSRLKLTLSQGSGSQLNHLLTVPKPFRGTNLSAASSPASSSGNPSSNPLAAAWQAYSSLQQNPLNSALSNSALTQANSLNINV
jgi:hypothetical protein